MIKARMGEAWIFGIDENNVQALKDGKLMLIGKEETGLPTNIVFIYGETLEDCAKEIENQTGVKLPGFMSEHGNG